MSNEPDTLTTATVTVTLEVPLDQGWRGAPPVIVRSPAEALAAIGVGQPAAAPLAICARENCPNPASTARGRTWRTCQAHLDEMAAASPPSEFRRVYHRADKISAGGVSALCFKRPRAIDMRPDSGQTWTTDDAAVTCPRCRKAITARDRDAKPGNDTNAPAEPGRSEI